MLMVSTFDSFFWTFILSLYIIIQQLVVIMNNKRLRRTNNIRLNNTLGISNVIITNKGP